MTRWSDDPTVVDTDSVCHSPGNEKDFLRQTGPLDLYSRAVASPAFHGAQLCNVSRASTAAPPCQPKREAAYLSRLACGSTWDDRTRCARASRQAATALSLER